MDDWSTVPQKVRDRSWKAKGESDRPPDGKEGGKRGGRGSKGHDDDGYRRNWKGKGDWSNEGSKGRRGFWKESRAEAPTFAAPQGKEGKGGGGKASTFGAKQESADYDDYSPGGYGYGNRSSPEGNTSAAFAGRLEFKPVPVVREPPPPALWTEYTSDYGGRTTPYFYNARTGLTQWEKPEELEQASKQALEAANNATGRTGFGSEREEQRRARNHQERDMDRETIRDMEREEHRRARNNRFDEGARVDRSGAGTAVRTDPRRREGGKGGKDPGKKGANAKEEPNNFGPPGCNLFVFHLPDDWIDEDLYEYFAPHGAVVSAKVMKELGTGRSRGFGFVSFEDRVIAATALKKMQGFKVHGKRLKVEFKKGEGEESGEKPAHRGDPAEDDASGGGDDRLIGYLRAISAKNVVESLKESEGNAEEAELPEKVAEDLDEA